MIVYEFLFIATFGSFVQVHHTARILALIPYKAHSHFPVFESLLKGLATRGHEVVVVSHYPQKNPVANYTDISILGAMPGHTDKVRFEQNSSKMVFPPLYMILETTEVCELVFKHSSVQEFLKYKDKFDVIITEIFGSDCFLGFVHKFRAPYIGVMTSIPYPWSNFRVANPDNPSYIPNYFLPYTDKMCFAERLVNTLYFVVTNWAHYLFSELPTYKISKEYLGDNLPPLSEIAKNVSLILVNNHFSLSFPRPTVPAFVEVGGLHIQEPRKLPEDIQLFLDEAYHGAIYFSMGTMVRSDTLPPEKLQAFLDAFAALSQRVLWKSNASNMPQLPANVRTYQWMPQRDILEHPNVRVFITHGGMLGTQEAVHIGVPMLGIPLFADQMFNIRNYVSKGIAVEMDFDSITKETLLAWLRELLYDPSYRDNAKRMSRIFRDRPQTPIETAIFWTEYVIRHRGAAHLRSAAMSLPWYQYLLLDVAAVLLMVATLLSASVYVLCKLVFYRIVTKINFVVSTKRSLKMKKRN